MRSGSLRQIAGPVGVQAVPVDGLRAGQFIEVLVGRDGIENVEAHAADRGKSLAGGKSHGTIEQKLVHRMSLGVRNEKSRVAVIRRDGSANYSRFSERTEERIETGLESGIYRSLERPSTYLPQIFHKAPVSEIVGHYYARG